jgi:hypothetical protein
MLVRDIFALDKTEGLIGLEIEVEANNLPDRVPGFHREYDGSLRGESAEFVFRGPVGRKEAEDRVQELVKMAKDLIVVKSVSVLVNNSISNTFLLMAKGIPILLSK